MFSGADLLSFEYMKRGKFIDKLFHKVLFSVKTPLTIELPKSVHDRLGNFLNDLYETSDWDVTINNMCQMRLTHFVRTVRKYSDPNDLFKRLQSITKTMQVYMDGEEKNKFSVFSFYNNEMIELRNLTFNTDEVLRSEYALQDMKIAYPDHDYTVEKIITALICDFVHQLQTNGKGVLEDVVQTLEREWEH